MLKAMRSGVFNRWVLVCALTIGYSSCGFGCFHHHDDDHYGDHRDWDHHDRDFDHHDHDHY
jgi:hypothetical protein